MCNHVNIPPSRPTGIILHENLCSFRRHSFFRDDVRSLKRPLEGLSFVMCVRSCDEQALSSISFLAKEPHLPISRYRESRVLDPIHSAVFSSIVLQLVALSICISGQPGSRAGQWRRSKAENMELKLHYGIFFFHRSPFCILFTSAITATPISTTLTAER